MRCNFVRSFLSIFQGFSYLKRNDNMKVRTMRINMLNHEFKRKLSIREESDYIVSGHNQFKVTKHMSIVTAYCCYISLLLYSATCSLLLAYLPLEFQIRLKVIASRNEAEN